MSAIVDYSFYVDTYKGTEATQATFPALEAHASRVIDAMTRYQVNDQSFLSLPSFLQTLYRLAVCAEIDFLAINGTESLSTVGGVGFSVGKVRVDGSNKSSAGGAMSANVAPAAMLYLEQSGLLYPGVGVWQC